MTVDKNLIRGDSRNLDFFASLPQATPDSPITAIDLTGARVVFTVKLTREDGTSVHADPPVIVKTSDDAGEIEISDQTGALVGQGVVHLLPGDTKFLEPGVYVYDVRVYLAGQAMTVVRGRIYLEGDVGSAEDMTRP